MNTKQLIDHVCKNISFTLKLRSDDNTNKDVSFEIQHFEETYSDNPNRFIVRFMIMTKSYFIWKRDYCYILNEYESREEAEEFYLKLFLEELIFSGIMFGYKSVQELKKIK